MNTDNLLSQLSEHKITHLDFLNLGGYANAFRNWCRSLGLPQDEGNAEFYCDMAVELTPVERDNVYFYS